MECSGDVGWRIRRSRIWQAAATVGRVEVGLWEWDALPFPSNKSTSTGATADIPQWTPPLKMCSHAHTI